MKNRQKGIYICLFTPFLTIFSNFWGFGKIHQLGGAPSPEPAPKHAVRSSMDLRLMYATLMPEITCHKFRTYIKHKSMKCLPGRRGITRCVHNVYVDVFWGMGGSWGWTVLPVFFGVFTRKTPGHAKMCKKCPVEPLSNRFFRLPP